MWGTARQPNLRVIAVDSRKSAVLLYLTGSYLTLSVTVTPFVNLGMLPYLCVSGHIFYRVASHFFRPIDLN